MTPEIGKAYRGRDGVTRWVTGRSRRGNYYLLWHDEEEDVWHTGGSIRAEEFDAAGLAAQGEAAAPAPGERYRRMGVMGIPHTLLRPLLEE